MPPLDRFFHKKIALVNLGNGTVAVEPWPRAVASELDRCIPGGSAAAVILSAVYGDALILATGPLTGTAVPGSSPLIASCPDSGGTHVHLPIPLRHGLALKTAGVDFAVLIGTAAAASALILAGSGPRIEPAEKLAGLDIPGLRRAFRARFPETRHSLLLCGPSAPMGAVALEAGSSLDRGVMAGWMSRHNLTAVALAGGGPLPAATQAGPLSGALGTKSGTGGFLDVLEHVEGGPQAKAAAQKLLGRAAACRSCPWPCMAYLRPGPSTSGLLCADHAGFAALCGACPESVTSALEACARMGIDPVAASPVLHGLQPEAFEPVLEKLPSGARGVPVLPLWPYAEAGARATAGMVLGVCPILLQRCPDIPIDQWISELGAGQDSAALRDRLNASLEIAGKALGTLRQKNTELQHG